MMKKMIAKRLLVLGLVTASIMACGRDEPEAASAPIAPTFTPTSIVTNAEPDIAETSDNVADNAVKEETSERRSLDLTTAATELGVTEEALAAALGDRAQGRADIAVAAQQLGVTEAELVAALGLSLEGRGSGREERSNSRPSTDSP